MVLKRCIHCRSYPQGGGHAPIGAYQRRQELGAPGGASWAPAPRLGALPPASAPPPIGVVAKYFEDPKTRIVPGGGGSDQPLVPRELIETPPPGTSGFLGLQNTIALVGQATRWVAWPPLSKIKDGRPLCARSRTSRATIFGQLTQKF